jgi:hypothetical protein
MLLLTSIQNRIVLRSQTLAQGVCALVLMVLLTPFAQAGMSSMTETELSDVSGAGLAIALDDFRYLTAPTSYFEQVGQNNPGSDCSGTGSSASNTNCWRRGDLRWYGVSISGVVDGGSHWNESGCDATSLACPRGGQIDQFSPYDNPYLVRAWSPAGMGFDGTLINSDPNNPNKTIFEFLAPTNQPDYKFSFWGEIEAGATRDAETEALTFGQGDRLKSQTIIQGNAAGSIFRLFQFTEPGNETFGIFYHSHLQGDFRFSVAQDAGAATDVIGQAPVFDEQEGLHFRNVDAYLPFGQLYYQAMTLGAVGTAGDFYLELTQLPNTPSVYNRSYSLNSGDARGFETARLQVASWDVPCAANDTGCQNYRLSHGHVRYGDWYPGDASHPASSGTRNSTDDQSDGMYFSKCSGCADFTAFAKRPVVIDKRGETGSMQRTQNYNCSTGGTGNCSVIAGGGPTTSGPGNNTRVYNTGAVNIGDARIEGLLIQFIRMESCQSGGC